MTDPTTGTRITQVGTVMIPVEDQDRAIAFYLDKLGFEKLADTPFGRGDRWVEVAPPGASTTIALVTPREGNPRGSRRAWASRPRTRTPTMHSCAPAASTSTRR